MQFQLKCQLLCQSRDRLGLSTTTRAYMADEARLEGSSPAADERPAVLIIGGLGSLSCDITLTRKMC